MKDEIKLLEPYSYYLIDPVDIYWTHWELDPIYTNRNYSYAVYRFRKEDIGIFVKCLNVILFLMHIQRIHLISIRFVNSFIIKCVIFD